MDLRIPQKSTKHPAYDRRKNKYNIRMAYNADQKEKARIMFLQGHTVPEIADALKIERRTLYLWAKSEDWNKAANKDDVFYSIKKRIALLLERENKTALELKELHYLLYHLRTLEKLKIKAQERKEQAGGEDRDGKPEKRGRKKRKNDFCEINEKELLRKFENGLFKYQLDMWNFRRKRNRNILKSRQIGFTYYFAREALVDAILSGRNKIFLSASRAQADMFRDYIRSAALEYCGIDLAGKDKIELQTRHGVATLYFLSTNSSTAQSYHGDVYIDEYFWIPKFDVLKKVASAMASQEQYTRTYFSTPSAKMHPAYKFWSGDEFNERRKRANQPLSEFPTEKELRDGGRDCPDGQFRIIITIEDAIKGGCDLFDLNQLQREYSEDEFQQLFLCRFPNDGQGCFSFSELEKCLADSSEWEFYHPDSDHPYHGAVWIGYDPSRNRDGACIVVIAPPAEFGGKFYVLEKITLHNASWEYQANTIRDLCDRYNVDYIGIDITGPGSGVYEMVQKFFPYAEAINYSLEVKTKLVLKAQQIIKAGRIEWDANYSDIAAGFLLIRRATGISGVITYIADRSDLTGHADSAWAIMHALIHEDLIPEEEQGCCII